MNKLLNISEAANYLGVSTSTLRRWEREEKLIPDERTRGGQRRYALSTLDPKLPHIAPLTRKTLAYARVSSHDQKNDLERQINMLEMYCAANGWQAEIISDLGSGMNYNKKGLKKLISDVLDNKIHRLLITHKDRLLRFGAELIFSLCEAKQVEVIIINQSMESSFEEDLAKDVLEIITVFSARLYGSRSKKNRQLIEKLQQAVLDENHS